MLRVQSEIQDAAESLEFSSPSGHWSIICFDPQNGWKAQT